MYRYWRGCLEFLSSESAVLHHHWKNLKNQKEKQKVIEELIENNNRKSTFVINRLNKYLK